MSRKDRIVINYDPPELACRCGWKGTMPDLYLYERPGGPPGNYAICPDCHKADWVFGDD